MLNIIKDPNFISKIIDVSINDEEVKEKDEIILTPVKWYPENLVWQLNIFKKELKKKKGYEKLHKFIQRATDAGLISRQELVSMIPPLLLDVQSTDIIFDMCAAPGNKHDLPNF